MGDPPPGDFAALLLDWYDRERRDLPWRARPGERPDPYQVWVSEVMLQQTRVDTARPYFERWMRRFPTLDALAGADLDDVLKAWEGLGYYARARNLHRAVREVATRYGARIPDDPASFRALPGVGRYTAGAVLSIAFGRAEPVVDGNVRRVAARILDERDPSERRLWEIAGAWLPSDRPGDFNQALMELGATVCTPRKPACDACPVAFHCRARAAGTQEERPVPRRKAPQKSETYGVAVIGSSERVLVVRRPVEGRLGGLWELPSAAPRDGESPACAAIRAAAGVGVPNPRIAVHLGRVRHDFTHVRVFYEAYTFDTHAPHEGVDRRWLTTAARDRLTIPTAQKKILRLLSPVPR